MAKALNRLSLRVAKLNQPRRVQKLSALLVDVFPLARTPLRRLRRPRPVRRALTQRRINYASDKSFTASGSVARDAAAATAFLDAHTRRTPGRAETKKIQALTNKKGKRKDAYAASGGDSLTWRRRAWGDAHDESSADTLCGSWTRGAGRPQAAWYSWPFGDTNSQRPRLSCGS